MASRTKQKEEARARRLAEERARAEQAARRRRMQTLGGVVLAAVAVVAVAIAISSGGGGKAGLKQGAAQKKTVAAVSQLLTGIPQSGVTLGNPKAPVTMNYFGDLECPICADFTLSGGFPQLVQNEVRGGKVKVVYKSFETATGNPATFQTQQVAAIAAGAQNKFWDFAELFYREQGAEGSGYVTESYLDSLARQVSGLNVSTWKSARNNQTYIAQVSGDNQSASTAGITGTPTLIFTGPKGKQSQPSSAVPSYSDLQNAIKQVS
jgi:protein-disulfide isomerase